MADRDLQPNDRAGGAAIRATRRRVPELDGLRGVAILLVMSAHLALGAAPADRRIWADYGGQGGGGGLIGVQLFFVLSGFLITKVLVDESKGRGLRLRSFYARRIRRLYPALIALCVVYGLYVLTFSDQDLGDASGAIGLALTHTTNLGLPVANSGWLGHTWSLAVEEQFYLLWPPILAVFMARGTKRGALLAATGIAATTILVRYVVPMGDTTMYHLFRWDALLIGCAIALHGPARLRFRGVGWLGAAIICFYVWYLPSPISPTDYLVTTIGCAAALVAADRSRWLAHPLLVRLGLISYSLYLWHVFVLRWGPPALVGLALSLLVAAISYRFVERPFLSRREILEPAI